MVNNNGNNHANERGIPLMAFHRSLGLFDSTMLVAGSMIGSGVFIVSADIARTVGSPSLLLLVWGITGLLTLIAASSYGELAGMMPQAGGQYVYLRKSFGPLAGFLYGWTLFTVIQTGTIAAVAMAFAKFTAVLIPEMSEKAVLFSFGTDAITQAPIFPISPAQILAITVIVLLTALNARGVELGKIIQNMFTSTKIISVVGLALVGLIIGLTRNDVGAVFSQASTIQFDTPLVLMTAIAVAMVGSVFSSDAWNNITFAAAEVKDPNRTIPRALIYGVVLVTALYILTNLAFVMLMPTMGDPAGADALARGISHATNDRVGSAAAEVMFGGAGAAIMAVLIMVSTFGCNNGLILSGSRAYFAMAADGLFFKRAAVLNAKGVPASSLWIQCIWASALCLSGTYGALLDYVVIAALIFYSLTILGIFRLRRTQPLAERPIKAFGYPFLPALYIVAATFICVVLLIEKPGTTWPGFLIIALGVPVYFAWTMRTKVQN